MTDTRSRYAALSFLISILVNPYIHSTILHTSTLAPIKEACANAGPETLAIWDIDDVLIMGQDLALKMPYRNQLLYTFYGKDYQGIEYLSGYIWPTCRISLVDNDIPSILDDLQTRSVRTMGLTAGWAGPVANCPKLEKAKTNRLKEVGIDLKWSFAPTHRLEFKNLEVLEHYPTFYNGILFCCKLNKEVVLEEFLTHEHMLPVTPESPIKKIIFVDDYLPNVERMDARCSLWGIECLSIHYDAVEQSLEPLNQERAQFQFDYLIEHHRWLSDEEADRVLATTGV